MNVEMRRLKRQIKVFNKSGIIGKALSHGDETADTESNQSESVKPINPEKVFAALAKANITVPSDYKDAIVLGYDAETEMVTVAVCRNVLDKKSETLGYYCLVSSVPKAAQEMADEYMLRDYAENAFSAMKTELGFRTLRGHGSNIFHARFFTCYIADIIRNEIVRTFQWYEEKKHCSISTNEMIASFSEINYKRSGNGYIYTGQTSVAQREILESLGITSEALKTLGPLVSARIKEENLGKLRSTQRELPVVPEKRGPGRPKGSLNKPKDSGSKKNKPAKKENGKQGKKDTDNAQIEDHTGNDSFDNTTRTSNTSSIDNAGRDDRQEKATSVLGSPSSEIHALSFTDAGSNALIHDGEQQIAVEREEAETAGKTLDITGDIPTEGLEPAKANLDDTINANEAEEQPSKTTDESKPSIPLKTTRTGTQYLKTIIQDKYDRELSEKTGIDIIGNPPPRPWSEAFRAAETRRRNRLRKEAEKKWREICAAASPEPDQ